MPAGAILWGSAYQNTLLFGYPLYDVLTDREARDGSEVVQAPSGIEDSWITGRDYVLTAQAKFLDDSPTATPSRAPVAGPLGWQDFLDFARAKNPFRFCPDAAYLAAYVDGCYLVEPLKGFGANLENLQRGVALKIRNPTVDFMRALRGILFEYGPGTDITQPVAATFTRADATTCATYVDAAGLVQTVAANVLRDRHYVGGVRTTPLEGARTNLCLYSEQLNHGSWVKGGVGSVVVTDDAFLLGELALSHLVNPAANNNLYRSVTVAGGTEAFSIYVKGDGTAASYQVTFQDSGATNRFVAAVVIAAAGTVTMTPSVGTVLAAELLGSGVYRVLCAAPSCAAGAGLVIPFGASGAQSFYTGGVQVEDAVFPSSYVKTTAAAVTRAADSLLFPFTAVPQTMTAYVRFRYGDDMNGIIWAIGGSTVGTPRWYLAPTAGTYYSEYDGVNGGLAAVSTSAPAFGDLVEYRAVLQSSGAMTVGQSLNAGTEAVVTVASSTASVGDAAFSGTNFFLGAYGSTGYVAFNAHESVKVAPGVRTLAQMRAM